jgi:Insertion element 4 transposase N-terminal
VGGAQEPAGGRLTDHISLGVLSAAFSRDLIEEVIAATGKREKRSRLLPAHVMVRYVIALGLFFGQAYEEVMRQMTGCLLSLGSWDQGWKVPSTSAITQARQRLGAGPLKELFHRVAVPVAGLGTTGAWLRGRRLMALDGTSFDVPDTAGNAAAFHKMGSGPKESAFPKLQVVSLSECGTHAQVASAMGSCRTGERELAAQLAGAADQDMLITADSGFYSWQLWCSRRQALTQFPGSVVDPQVPGDNGDGLAGLDHHLHGLSLELRAELAAMLWHETDPLRLAESHCPRSLIHLNWP